jgi:hypothetical protein
MRFRQFSENSAMDDTVEIMKKSFSPERKAVQAEVLELVRAVQMGKGDKMELAMKLTALTKRELEAKRNDPDLKISVDQNIGMMKRAMDKLTGVTESVGEIAELTETEVVKIIRSKRGLGSLRNRSAYDGLSKIKNIELDKKDAPKKAVANESDIDEFDFFDDNIDSIEDLENYNWDSVSDEEIKDLLRYADFMYDANALAPSFTPDGANAEDPNGYDVEALGFWTDASNFLDNLLAQRQGNVSESLEALTEAEFDEAAGEKDACYRKVKSRYKVWPSAYASGALVKCRKVGAANWGNSKKK